MRHADLPGTAMALAAAALLVALAGARAGAAQQLPAEVEATSLLGQPLRTPALPPETRARYGEQLAQAAAAAAAAPDDADALIWLGRRTAYLGRYREAIAIYTRALRIHPRDARLYRHRGHRWLTVRELNRAVADLSRAAELARGRPDETEPDGLPNVRGIPTSTLHSNIYYHLALAHYVRGDFAAAAESWAACLSFSRNPDMLVATTYWYWLTLRRLGRADLARALLEPIHAGLDVIENHTYHRLLLLFKGELPEDSVLPRTGTTDALQDATLGYGVGAWHLVEGRPQRAAELFRQVLAGGNWPAFGYLAAEAEITRSTTRERGNR